MIAETFAMASLTAAVLGNLSTDIVKAHLSRLPDSPLRAALSDVGIVQADHARVLKKALTKGIRSYFQENPRYRLQFMIAFLKDERVQKEISSSFSDLRVLNSRFLAEIMAHYAGVEIEHAPDAWPNEIDPFAAIARFSASIRSAIYETGDPALLVIGQGIGDLQDAISTLDSKIAHLSDITTSALDTIINRPQPNIFAEFEADYVAHVSGRASKLTTPGARDLHGVNQDLSVAYISLHLKSAELNEGVRAEDFVLGNQHFCIRGPAGSGKTTLLNWLTVKCARDDSSSGNTISGRVPFIIPLRRVARLDPGAPVLANFVRYSTDEGIWTKATPDGWLDHVLKNEQRAIIMIDGVDELPRNRREAFWQWLDDFSSEYSGNRIIVTSRTLPGSSADGASTGWSPPKHFGDAQLMEMSDTDISAFIDHWHRSVDKKRLDSDETSRLRAAQNDLPKKLADPANKRIRELCSTPLLCAMVCVLHWKEEGYLPRYRVELYEKCCEMLIEARDMKRDIMPPTGALSALTRNDKEMALQQLAFEMMQNAPDGDDEDNSSYRVEISREKAVLWIDRKIKSFQAPEARDISAEEVLNFLIERTGLLREPATGLIDFPHRTFQEYLAACAAGAESLEDQLAKQADDDQWHETIMLAAGTTTGGVSFGRRLIEALIRRAERFKSQKAKSQHSKKTCLALALGCLENLRQHDPELRVRVLSNISNLVPPISDADAKILAVAGDAAVSHLTYDRWKDERTATVAACARSLRLIGTAFAIKTLSEGYASDVREAVAAEVSLSQSIPLSEIPVIKQYVENHKTLPHYVKINNMAIVAGLDQLTGLTISKGYTNPEAIAGLTQLERIIGEGLSGDELADLGLGDRVRTVLLSQPTTGAMDWVERFPNLSTLTIAGSGVDIDCKPIGDASGLTSLAFHRVNLTSSSDLGRLGALKALGLYGASLDTGHGALSKLSLTDLVIEEPNTTKDVATFVTSQKDLTNLTLTLFAAVSQDIIWDFPKLQTLRIHFDPSYDSIQGLRLSSNLNSLEFAGLANLRSLEGIHELEALSSLRILDCPISSVDGVTARHRNLASISIVNADIVGVENFSDLPSLTDLEIGECDQFKTLVAHSDSITSLKLNDLQKLSDISNIGNLKALKSLEIANCPALEKFGEALISTSIERLSLRFVNGPPSMEEVAQINSLRELEIHGAHRIDLTPLNSAPNLQSVTIYNDDGDFIIPEELSSRVKMQPYFFYPDPFFYRRAMFQGRSRNNMRRDFRAYSNFK